MNFDINNYEPDVKAYIRTEQAAANTSMKNGEIYVNGRGVTFRVLEDAPIGDTYVKVECYDKFGRYEGYRPKIVLIS